MRRISPKQSSTGGFQLAERQGTARGIAVLLAGMSALGPFSIDTYLPSFHDISEKLGATPIQVQQTLSAYLAAFALMTLWHGALADRFGRRRVVLLALALFAMARNSCRDDSPPAPLA